MRIGITFNLKSAGPLQAGVPDDAEEEFDSPGTIEAIAGVLRGMGHAVELLGDGREFVEKALLRKPDFVFNFAEGTGASRAREARAPAVLEMLGIPYTGSDPYTMAVTLDKDCAKKLVAAAGVRVPAGIALEPTTPLDSIAIDRLKFPLIVKPAWEGSSKGIRNNCLVESPDRLPEIVASVRRAHPQTVLLEEFIAGDELTVGLIGNGDPDVIGIMRVAPTRQTDRFIYSLEVKRNYQGNVRYECPPALPDPVLKRVAHAARTAFRALACRDIARIDFRLRAGEPYFLEANPLPGLNPIEGDLVILAKASGWSYERLVATIVTEAMRRAGLAH